MAARRKAATPERLAWVLTDPEDEAQRRRDFYEVWYSIGMTKGTGRAAYFEAGEAGMFGADGQDDLLVAAQQVAATKPSGDTVAAREWRRMD